MLKITKMIQIVFLKNFKNDFRAYPYSVFFSKVINAFFNILFPIIGYYFLFGEKLSQDFLRYGGTSSYLAFIILGQAISSFGFSSLTTTGSATVKEIHEGTFNQLLLSPCNRIVYFFGCYLEQNVLALFELIIMLIIGMFLNVYIQLSMLPGLIIAMLCTSLSSFMCSFLISSLFIYSRSVFLVENTIFYALNLLVGTYFPVEMLPIKLGKLSLLLPLTHSIKLIRGIYSDHLSIFYVLSQSGKILLLSIPYFIVGYVWFRKKIENDLIEKVFS